MQKNQLFFVVTADVEVQVSHVLFFISVTIVQIGIGTTDFYNTTTIYKLTQTDTCVRISKSQHSVHGGTVV